MKIGWLAGAILAGAIVAVSCAVGSDKPLQTLSTVGGFDAFILFMACMIREAILSRKD